MTAESDNPLDEVTFTVSSVARRLGVAPATLRTWDRRYGLGPSGHTAGLHRRYTENDLRRLEIMRRLVNQGTPASEAARAAMKISLSSVEPLAEYRQPGELSVTDLQLVDAPSRALARTALALDSTGCTTS